MRAGARLFAPFLLAALAACASVRNGEGSGGGGAAGEVAPAGAEGARARGAPDDPASREPSSTPTLAECVTGLVVAEGADLSPRTWVRPGDGEPVELLGAFTGNIRLLAGATVQVCGPGRTPTGALEAVRVELLQVDGMPAVLGRLEARGERWVLVPVPAGEAVPLVEVPEGLAAGAGAMAWAAGVRTADHLAVRSYALLRGWR